MTHQARVQVTTTIPVDVYNKYAELADQNETTISNHTRQLIIKATKELSNEQQ